MAVYKDEKQKTWYVSVRYSNWQGEKTRKVKRGFRDLLLQRGYRHQYDHAAGRT